MSSTTRRRHQVTYDKVLSMQLSAGAIAMLTLSGLFKQPKPSDEA